MAFLCWICLKPALSGANDPEIAAKLTTDGLHPNDLGHEILAGEIGDFLKGLAE